MLRQIGVNPVKRDRVDLYINFYTFIKSFVYTGIDNELTPTNMIAALKYLNVSSNVTDNLYATSDGGMSINVYKLANLSSGNTNNAAVQTLINSLSTNYTINATVWNNTVVPFIKNELLVVTNQYMIADVLIHTQDNQRDRRCRGTWGSGQRCTAT